MAEWGRGGGGKWWPFKRTTVAVCCVNLLALLYVLRALYTSLYVFSSSSSAVADASSGFSSFPGPFSSLSPSRDLSGFSSCSVCGFYLKFLRFFLCCRETCLLVSCYYEIARGSVSFSILGLLCSLLSFCPTATKFSEDQIQRMKESIQLRRASEPTELARLVTRI